MSIASWLGESSLGISEEGGAVSVVVCSEVRFGGVASGITLGDRMPLRAATAGGKAGVKGLGVVGGEESIEVRDEMGEGSPLDLPDASVEQGLRPTITLVGTGEESSFAEVGSISSSSMIADVGPPLIVDLMISLA